MNNDARQAALALERRLVPSPSFPWGLAEPDCHCLTAAGPAWVITNWFRTRKNARTWAKAAGMAKLAIARTEVIR